ncbi:unnamed protein product [[Candida] boidinii]|nr:unnamed protein product [[Candida] boidinii]
MKFNTTTTANISTSTTLNTNTNTNTNTNSNSIIKSDGENLNNFSNGEELWKLQNEEWLTPSSENDTRQGKLLLQKKVHDQEIKHCISSKDYHIVYKNLVINNKKLKKPMNLKDLVKVIEAGWNWTKVFENSSSNRF